MQPSDSTFSIPDLRAALEGRVIAPDDAGYDEARTGLELAVRSGGHSSAGHCASEGGSCSTSRIDGTSAFGQVAKYQARLHDSALDSQLGELSRVSFDWTAAQKVGGEWQFHAKDFTSAIKGVHKRVGELLTDSG